MGSGGSKERETEVFKKTASTSVMPTIVEEADGTLTEELEEEELFYSYKVDSFSGALNHNNKYNMQITGGQKNKIIGTQLNNLTYIKPNRKLSLKETERLDTIRKSLKILYSSEEAWLIPLQWLPNTRLEPELYFVDLEMEELSRGGLFTTKSKVTLDEMLIPEQGCNTAPKRILVRGEAGFGKSTLCTKIAYDWAIERRGGVAFKFELVIMYRLRDLEEGSNLEEELIEFCQMNCLTKNKSELTSETLTVKAEKVFLILDGYDEATEDQRVMVNEILGLNKGNYQSVFRASTILVTSRPTENANFLRLFQRHIRITGLSEASRKNLISKLMKYDSVKSRRVEENLNAFDYLFLRDLSPFLLYLICYLHDETGEDQELDTPFKLLEAVTNFLGKRCSEREQLYMKDEEINETLHQLGDFFFDKLKSSKMVYLKNELRKFFVGDKKLRLVEKCGILKTPATFKENYAETLEPIHKLFVEYLSTFYLNNFFNKKCNTSEEKLRFLSNVTKKFGGTFHFYSPSSSEMYLVVETWVDGIEFLLSVNFMEKEKLKCLSNGDFLFTSDPRARKITSGISENSWNSSSVRMNFRKMEEDSGFPGAKAIIPYWIRGREFAASVLDKMIHQDYVVLVFWQDNFKTDETKETSMEFDFLEDDNILWSCVLKLSTQFNPETTTNVDPSGTLVFRKLTLTMRLTDLPKDYMWCKRFTSFTLRCSRDMPAIGDKVRTGELLHALITCLESCKQYKWCRFDITPKNFDRAFAIDCLVKRGRVKLNLLEGKSMNEIIRVSRFLERRESFIQKLNFDFYEDDRQLLFIVVKN